MGLKKIVLYRLFTIKNELFSKELPNGEIAELMDGALNEEKVKRNKYKPEFDDSNSSLKED